MKELLEILCRLASSPDGAVLATLVSVGGSSYRRKGARLLLTPDGERIGSISGGCLEEDVLARARQVARTGRAELVTYDTTTENDLVWGVGLGCHGVVQVLIEKLPAAPDWARSAQEAITRQRAIELAVVWTAATPALLGTRLGAELPAELANAEVFRQTVGPRVALVVYGAGDDAQPLVRLAAGLGWHVTVADPRASHATSARFPAADRIVIAPAAELVARTTPGPDTVAVVMTHHYVHDVPVLRALLPVNLDYVGLLGPKQRADRILADLARDGFVLAAAQSAGLYAPVGLDLGAESPEEVAVSIIAEILSVLSGRDGRPLRLRTRPIHA